MWLLPDACRVDRRGCCRGLPWFAAAIAVGVAMKYMVSVAIAMPCAAVAGPTARALGATVALAATRRACLSNPWLALAADGNNHGTPRLTTDGHGHCHGIPRKSKIMSSVTDWLYLLRGGGWVIWCRLALFTPHIPVIGLSPRWLTSTGHPVLKPTYISGQQVENNTLINNLRVPVADVEASVWRVTQAETGGGRFYRERKCIAAHQIGMVIG